MNLSTGIQNGRTTFPQRVGIQPSTEDRAACIPGGGSLEEDHA